MKRQFEYFLCNEMEQKMYREQIKKQITTIKQQ